MSCLFRVRLDAACPAVARQSGRGITRSVSCDLRVFGESFFSFTPTPEMQLSCHCNAQHLKEVTSRKEYVQPKDGTKNTNIISYKIYTYQYMKLERQKLTLAASGDLKHNLNWVLFSYLHRDPTDPRIKNAKATAITGS